MTIQSRSPLSLRPSSRGLSPQVILEASTDDTFVLGVGGALALTRLMTSMLFGVVATDITTYVAVAALLGLTALVASYLPARRALRIDPVTALREE